MKKRILASLLAFCMVTTIIPSTALATGDDGATNVAQIGEDANATKYATFTEAYNAASDGATIKLLEDTTWMNPVTKSTLSVNKSFTLDLNGKTLEVKYTSSKGVEAGAFLQLEQGTLTIKDSSAGCNGRLTSTYSSYLVRLYGGNLTLESGTLATDTGTRTVYVNRDTSTFTMNRRYVAQW